MIKERNVIRIVRTMQQTVIVERETVITKVLSGTMQLK